MDAYKPIILAHRGFSAKAPENTMTAFEAAKTAGADGIELDVQLSKDGKLVVIHDEHVERTTNGSGWVQDLTYEQLKKFDAGSWFGPSFQGERIPLLTDVLEWAYSNRMLVNIEFKNGRVLYPEIEKKTIQAVLDLKMLDQVLISSFNHYSLRLVKRLDPRFRIGLLYQDGLVQPWHYAKQMQAIAIHPHFIQVISELVHGCHSNQIMVNTWTVNEMEDIRRMVDRKVDTIITNYPDRVRQVLQHSNQGSK
jgi:glycerophosphoryl diester phosphodiesterase